jgi:nucleotide sugar dehydrogenase
MISVIGLGFVGGSMKKSFELKGEQVKGYDKFKDNTDSFEDCLKSDIAFLALPTIFDENKMTYDKSAIHEVCGDLEKHKYKGLVVIKSTVEPTTTEGLASKYSSLKFIHNPEFLTAATAFEDFHNQKHIVLGKSKNVKHKQVNVLEEFYRKNYPDAEVSRCSCTESESMKSFVNCFYSVKIQFFNELYLLCEKMGCDYNNVKDLMLKNGWINPMHTDVPGVDGMLSYGGYCFPKDTNALLNHMKRENVTCKILEGTVLERNEMRKDNVNVKLKNETDFVTGFDSEVHVESNSESNMKNYITPTLIGSGIIGTLLLLYKRK